jgi:hypothetical protein
MAEILNHADKLWTAITNVKGDTNIAYTIRSSNSVKTEEGFNEIIWVSGHDESDTPPEGITWDKVNAEMTRLQAEYDAQDYARKRKAEYPSIQDLVVALYDTDDKSAIEAKRAEVKAKYPKP